MPKKKLDHQNQEAQKQFYQERRKHFARMEQIERQRREDQERKGPD